MEERKVKEYIENITKASTCFILKNGPVKELEKSGKITKGEVEAITKYLQNHLAYLYTVLLEENNLKKFELIVNTMNKFYLSEDLDVKISDDGFDNLYRGLFPGIEIKK